MAQKQRPAPKIRYDLPIIGIAINPAKNLLSKPAAKLAHWG